MMRTPPPLVFVTAAALSISILVLFTMTPTIVAAAAAETTSSRFNKGGKRGTAALDADRYRAPQAEALLRNLSLDEQLRELNQFDINGVMYADKDDPRAAAGDGFGWIDEDKVAKLLKENRVGSFFNSPSSNCGNKVCPVPPASWYRKLIKKLWELSRTLGSRVPIIFGIDSIHGATYILNATLFPQQIGTAATFNTTHAKRMGQVTSRETRYAGIPWVFSPVLGIAVQPSWSRVFETFGEDPHLTSRMGVAAIEGYQQAPSEPTAFPDWTATKANYTVAACAKHFVGYPDARTGRDRTPVQMPYNSMLQYYMPSFEAAVNEANVLSMMENYIELNGKPVVASNLILDFLLRGQQELNFQNMLVTDYNEIFNLADFHMYSANYRSAIYDSLNQTTVDMAMVAGPDTFPVFVTDELKSLLGQSPPKMDLARVQASARRVLELKARLGLIDDERLKLDSGAGTIEEVLASGATSPVPPEQTAWEGPNCRFGCKEHRQAALEAARESIVLLQNEPADPSKKDGRKVLPVDALYVKNVAVIGQGCNNKGLMSGGWTVHWQGTSNDTELPNGATILEQLQQRLGGGAGGGTGAGVATVTYSEGCNVTEGSECGEEYVAETLMNTKAADLVVLCIGERHYAEKPGDIFDLGLPGGQKGLVQKMVEVNGVPKERIVAVLLEGRPRLLGAVPQQVGAVLHAFLPGPMGGEAIVDVLLGKTNPSGRLPITYPKTYNGAPVQYWRKYSANTETCAHAGDCTNDYTGAIQWPFGHGLSYTSFEYSALDVQLLGNDITVSVTVTNTGSRFGQEAVLVYSTQTYRRITPEVQMLRAFEKVALQPKAKTTVRVQFSYTELGYFDETNCMNFDSSPYTIMVGKLHSTQNITDIFMTVPLRHAQCSEWGRYFLDRQSGPPQFPTQPPTTAQDEQDYFISSICTFGAGIVITVIVISFIRRRQTKNEDNLLEPAGI